MSKINFRLIIFICAIIALGFLRDFVFVYTNLILYNKLHNESFPIANPISLMNSWDYYSVYYMKFVFTFICVVLYLFIGHRIISILFHNPLLNRIYFAIFILVFFVSGIIFSFGLLTNEAEKYYGLSRELLGFIQSPLPLMLLIPIGIFMKTDQNKNAL